jgi:bifunctional enzyme CysN/CysC
MKEDAPSLKIVIVGHVDHGKSTLVGRLLADTNSLPEGKLESVKKACQAEGMDFEYAFVLDALLEEQQQNITLDTTQVPFRTAWRNYVIIDAPGHKEFLKNMISGAARADAAVLVLDASEGMQEQSRRHGYMLEMLGVKQLVVAINKMDLVDFSEKKFNEVCSATSAFLEAAGLTPSQFVPISARHGENICEPDKKMKWHKGPTLLAALDNFTLPPSPRDLPLRLVVQDVYRFDNRRIIAGRVESGRFSIGDEIVFWPDRKRGRIKSIETWPKQSSSTQAEAGTSVAVTLTEPIFVERGQIGAHPVSGPIEGREFKARIFWLSEEPLRTGQAYRLKLATQSVEAKILGVSRVVNSSTLETTPAATQKVARYEVAEVRLRMRSPIAFDNSDRVTATSRFVLLRDDRIAGGGTIHGESYPSVLSDEVKSENISWTLNEISREERTFHFGHRGMVIWLTGLPGAGKSTLAVALETSLVHKGIAAFVLDGDNLRHGLCADLGFTAEDRRENNRRAAEAARLLAEAGLVVIVALISPFASERQKAKETCHAAGIPFAEVYVNAPLSVCESRDPKKLYRRARAGEIKGFTGIDSPYEAPTKPDLELHSDVSSPQECLEALLELAEQISKLNPK